MRNSSPSDSLAARRVSSLLLATCCFVGLCASGLCAGNPWETRSRARAGEPTQQAGSKANSQLPSLAFPSGLTCDLMAASPLVDQPSCLAWDERGRLFVIDAGPNRAVRLLEDQDDDGRLDHATIWAELVGTAQGIACAQGGLLLTGGQEIVQLVDTDQDRRADQRNVLYAGFSLEAAPRRQAAPIRDLDGWIYLTGAAGETITGPKLVRPVTLGHGDFRIRAEGTAIEMTSHDSQGRGFAWNVARDLFVVSPETIVDVMGPSKGNRAPASDSPRTSAPSHSLRSPLFYPDEAIPGLFDQLLACEPERQRVWRRKLARTGARYRFAKLDTPDQGQLLAATDGDFRPQALFLAPDSSLWIIDRVIPAASDDKPDAAKNVSTGDAARPGRIWRLAAKSPSDSKAASSSSAHDLTRRTPEQWVQDATGKSAWKRETAARLIVERRVNSTMDALSQIVRDAGDARAVMTALSVLDQLDSLNSDLLAESLADTDPIVRRHSLRLCQTVVDKRPGLLDVVLSMTNDPDARVRLQVALALGGTRSVRAIPALAKLARSDGHDPWMQSAIVGSSVGAERELRAALTDEPEALGQATEVLKVLPQAAAK